MMMMMGRRRKRIRDDCDGGLRERKPFPIQMKLKLLWKDEGEPFKEMGKRNREGGGRKANRHARHWQKDRKGAQQRDPHIVGSWSPS